MGDGDEEGAAAPDAAADAVQHPSTHQLRRAELVQESSPSPQEGLNNPYCELDEMFQHWLRSTSPSEINEEEEEEEEEVSEQSLQSRLLVWSTDVRSIRLYGQFLAGPEWNGHLFSDKGPPQGQKNPSKPACMVKFAHRTP